jgi:Protein of unknown function (DUF3500)
MRRVLTALALAALAPAPPPPDPALEAGRFLAALRPGLRARSVLPVSHEERTDWRFTPGRRPGVSLGDMAATERKAADAFLASALSARGYEKAKGVVELEGILREVEAFGSLRRDPDRYWLTFFGNPDRRGAWGWRFEGHHVSLNFSAAAGGLVSTTPAFFGANPARVERGPRRGWRLLAGEEDLARRLLEALNGEQRRAAVISASAPADILFGPGRRAVPEAAGIAFDRLNELQRRLLLQLVDEYFGNMRPDVAERERKRLQDAGVGRLRFAWAGSARPGEGHYYRVRGPTFLIEYDNTQDGANHVHSVWRDPENDFGGDLLRRHYAESPHHRDFRKRLEETDRAAPAHSVASRR